MTKNKHRFIPLLLAAVMILSLLPAGVFGAETVDSGKCGENVTWTLDSDGLLTISGTGEMDSHPYPKDSVVSVVIEDGVTSIGDDAFFGCSGLTSVTIPDSVTGIGWGAFDGCSGLTSVTIPGSVTSIGEFAFNDCSGLASVTIPDSVTSIGGGAFSGCTGLTSVTIGNGVTSIGGFAFYGCTGLTSVTIGNGVTSIGNYAFFGCSVLTSVTIPDSVTGIGWGAFDGCSGLTSVTIGNGVTSIRDSAFDGCSGLTDVYYTGTEAQWNAIDISQDNDPLISATKHYNTSNSEPTTEPTTIPTTEPATVPAAQPTTVTETEKPTVPDSLFNLSGGDISSAETADAFKYASSAALTKSQLVAAMTVRFEHAVITVEKDGFPITDDAPLGTGAVFYVYLSDEDMIAVSKTVIFMGDTDGDATVNATDARLALRAAAKLDTLEGAFGSAADTDGDGSINATDARGILRAAAKLDTLEVA